MRANRILPFVLFALALAFFAYIGATNWDEIPAVITQIDALHIIIAMVFVTASLFCKALMNLSMLRELLSSPADNLTLLHSYTKSQIVKYIPGKIWGIVFQASSLEDRIPKSKVWIVSVLQVLILNASTVVVLMAAVVLLESLSTSIKASIIFVCITGFALVYLNYGRVLRLARIDEATLREYSALTAPGMIGRLTLIVFFDWVFYVGMWGALAYGNLSYFEVFITAVNYSAASIVGWLVFVLPNGLAVREAVFVAIGQITGENVSMLVVYSVAARLLFLSGDFVLYLITAISKRIYERSKGTLGTGS